MKKTTNLQLPIYDTPEVDKFKLQDWNTANTNLESAYNEQNENYKKALDLSATNANLELVDARQGAPTLRDNIQAIKSQLAESNSQLGFLDQLKLKFVYGAKLDGTNDSDAIQEAVNDLKTGNILSFPSCNIGLGNTITINSDISLIGNNTIIKPLVNGMDILFKFSNVNNFKIVGFKFDDDLKGRTCIDILNCTNFEISNNHFTGYTSEYGYYFTDSAIIIGGSNIGKITNNTFENFGYQYTANDNLARCITLNGENDDNILISGNIFSKVNQGIIISGGSFNTITNNIFNEVQDNCIYALQYVKTLLISSNTIQNGHDENIVVTSGNINITGNNILDARNKAISINGNLESLVVDGNIFNNANIQETAGSLFFRDNNYIVKNLVYSNNVLLQQINSANTTYLSLGNVENLLIEGNIINVATIAYSRIIRIYGNTFNGFIKNNIITGTDDTSLAIQISSSAPVGNIYFEDNILTKCRVEGNNPYITYTGYDSQFIGNGNIYLINPIKRKIIYNNTFPTSTVTPFKKGDICYNLNPISGGYVGWICLEDGTPGIWKGFGLIQS